MFENIKFWIENARYHAVVQSFWAALVALCVGATYSNFDIKLAIIAIIGVLFAHLSINLLDDYFDFKSGSVEKRIELEGGVRSGKCKYLLENKATLRQLFFVAGVFGVIASLLGLYLFFQRGIVILFLIITAGIFGFFYSAPPLKLSYNGLGEVVVGLMFGPLLMNGVFYCATGTISLQLFLLSLAVGALVVNILYVHSILDKKADIAAGKKTLATILPNKFLRFFVFLIFSFYPYWIVGVGVFRYNMPKLSLLVFLTLPLVLVLAKFMYETVAEIEKKHTPRVWMGNMENWEKIEALGIGWFMIRWFLARNIMVFFSFFLCFAYMARVVL